MLLAQPVKEAVQNALDRVFYRDRYDYRRALVAFARDLNSDLDVVRLSQRLVARIVETLRRRSHGADAAPTTAIAATSRRSATSASPQPVPRLSRTSSFVRGSTPAIPSRSTIRSRRRGSSPRKSSSGATPGIYYFVPCVFEGAPSRCSRSAARKPTSRSTAKISALLTAVAGQVATAIENGRLYRQLHLKAEELGRMREFNENILESLDDGLVVFDADERIVRWNRALESFYGVTRTDAIGRSLGDVFDAPFVEALRAARREHPDGATLFIACRCASRTGRRSARLLVNATRGPAAERLATTPVRRRHDSAASKTSPIACGWKSSCRSPRRWRRSACWRPASRTKSTRR